MISKLYGFLSFNQRNLRKLSQVRLCSGRPQNCIVLDASTDIKGEYEAKLIENEKVTAKIGDAITLETSVQVSKEFYRLRMYFLSLLKNNAFSY